MRKPGAGVQGCSEVCSVWKIDADKVKRVRSGVPELASLEAEAAAFKALGHPRRLEILHALAGSDCCVCEITKVLDLPFSTVSQHLRHLRAAGWVRSRQSGKLVIYSLERPELLRALKARRGRPPGVARRR